MKRLANLKPSAAGPSSRAPQAPGRSSSFSSSTQSSKQCSVTLHPPQSLSRASSNGHLSFDPYPNYHSAGSTGSGASSTSDLDECDESHHTARASTRSRPAPSATTATSTAFSSSAFSSPSPSMRSLTTTLTTVQSTAPGSVFNASYYNPHPAHHHNPNGPPQMYSAPFDNPGSPAPQGLLHPVSYNAATAHGVWTDNASIITLASSSKRRRRSFDTDASVRALAPSSVFGGSRESLPLSMLSGNHDSIMGGRSVAGERASIHGSTFRSGDATSVHNGGSGSIMVELSSANQVPGSPLASPLIHGGVAGGGRSRRSCGWSIDAGDMEDERRSLSVRSASLKDGTECGEQTDVMSVRDGSSNVGVWHGISGKYKAPQDKTEAENARQE